MAKWRFHQLANTSVSGAISRVTASSSVLATWAGGKEVLLLIIIFHFQKFSDMGKDYELVGSTVIEEESMEKIYMKIVDEHPVIESRQSFMCDCWDICENCDNY